MRELHDFETEPEVRDRLASLSDCDFKRVDEVAGMPAERGNGSVGPWSDHREGPVRGYAFACGEWPPA